MVATLITNAAILGDTGTNNTGGGVINFIPNANLSAGNPAYVQVRLGPGSAVQAGAAWRLHGDSTYGSATNYTRTVTTNGATIEFKPLMGWDSPTNRTVQLTAGTVTVISNVVYMLAATQSVSPVSVA